MIDLFSVVKVQIWSKFQYNNKFWSILLFVPPNGHTVSVSSTWIIFQHVFPPFNFSSLKSYFLGRNNKKFPFFLMSFIMCDFSLQHSQQGIQVNLELLCVLSHPLEKSGYSGTASDFYSWTPDLRKSLFYFWSPRHIVTT